MNTLDHKNGNANVTGQRNDRGIATVILAHRTTAMGTLFYRITTSLGRFEDWFNRRFGWFFTNGMKDARTQQPPFKA